jgi:ribosome maturation factor RimP
VKTDQDRAAVEAALAEPLRHLGMDVEAVEITPAGKRRILRVAVDKDGGVTLDGIAEATKVVSRVLDDAGVMGEHPYTLEVTSPGIDRPLTLLRHWRRNVGRLVRVTFDDGTTVVGRVVATGDEAGGETCVLSVDGTERTVELARITKAKVEIEFNRKED